MTAFLIMYMSALQTPLTVRTTNSLSVCRTATLFCNIHQHAKQSQHYSMRSLCVSFDLDLRVHYWHWQAREILSFGIQTTECSLRQLVYPMRHCPYLSARMIAHWKRQQEPIPSDRGMSAIGLSLRYSPLLTEKRTTSTSTGKHLPSMQRSPSNTI